MKFLYVTDELLSSNSAETVHIHQLCKSLVGAGHAVELFAPRSKGFLPPSEYPVHFIPGGRWLSSLFFQVRLLARLKQGVEGNRPDIMYIRHNYLLFVPAMVAKKFGIPLVLECNGRLLEEAKLVERSVRGRLFLWLGVFRQIEVYNVRVASKLIAVAPGIRDYFMQKYAVPPSKIDVVLNGVDLDFFKPEGRALARQEVNLSPEPLYIGYIGSFYPWQGLRYIAQAAKELVVENTAVKFLIVGHGKDEAWLRSFVLANHLENSIEIRSAVAHTLVPTYINALDVCICYPTTFRDGATSPFKVYEYLACGKPVVLADIQGMREEFGDAVLYAKPESAEALAWALRSIVADTHMQDAFIRRARAFVEAGRSWQTVAEKIVTICQSVAR